MTRLVRFVGLISYSFYIWHHGAVLVVSKLLGKFAGQYHIVLFFVAGLIITVPIAYVSTSSSGIPS
jgi:peptidoglycan/LPS O-acetylase OafA/YrhL